MHTCTCSHPETHSQLHYLRTADIRPADTVGKVPGLHSSTADEGQANQAGIVQGLDGEQCYQGASMPGGPRLWP
eukprot:scaffold45020_cov18-Tisochrysis_lutea.AAC.2